MVKARKVIRRPKKWYVMLHLEPELIERQLQIENEARRCRGLRLFEYFVPYTFVPKAVPDPYAKNVEEQERQAYEANQLRTLMRQYVFIKASSNEATALVGRAWNREGRLHLHFYYSHDGRRITMPDDKMQSFINLCLESRQHFTFGPLVEDISDYDTVVISRGPFEDTEAVILDIQHTAGGISMTLGIPFFNGEKMLKLKDYKTADVHLPHSVSELLNDHFIDNVESELVAILNRRVKQAGADGETREEAALLTHLYHYSYVQIRDTPSHCRFRALMLICATLRADREAREHLTVEALQLLNGQTEAQTEGEAYLMAALYVATANADYRTAAKHYEQSHSTPDSRLTRLLSPLKRMNKRFFKYNKV